MDFSLLSIRAGFVLIVAVNFSIGEFNPLFIVFTVISGCLGNKHSHARLQHLRACKAEICEQLMRPTSGRFSCTFNTLKKKINFILLEFNFVPTFRGLACPSSITFWSSFRIDFYLKVKSSLSFRATKVQMDKLFLVSLKWYHSKRYSNSPNAVYTGMCRSNGCLFT